MPIEAKNLGVNVLGKRERCLFWLDVPTVLVLAVVWLSSSLHAQVEAGFSPTSKEGLSYRIVKAEPSGRDNISVVFDVFSPESTSTALFRDDEQIAEVVPFVDGEGIARLTVLLNSDLTVTEVDSETAHRRGRVFLSDFVGQLQGLSDAAKDRLKIDFRETGDASEGKFLGNWPEPAVKITELKDSEDSDRETASGETQAGGTTIAKLLVDLSHTGLHNPAVADDRAIALLQQAISALEQSRTSPSDRLSVLYIGHRDPPVEESDLLISEARTAGVAIHIYGTGKRIGSGLARIAQETGGQAILAMAEPEKNGGSVVPAGKFLRSLQSGGSLSAEIDDGDIGSLLLCALDSENKRAAELKISGFPEIDEIRASNAHRESAVQAIEDAATEPSDNQGFVDRLRDRLEDLQSRGLGWLPWAVLGAFVALLALVLWLMIRKLRRRSVSTEEGTAAVADDHSTGPVGHESSSDLPSVDSSAGRIEIEEGDGLFRLHIPRELADSVPLAWLEHTDEKTGVMSRLPLRSSGFRIGRNRDMDLQIRDSTISANHALIQKKRDGRFMITDLDSGNGVQINGERISQHPLIDGDAIQLGGVRLLFEPQSV